MNFKLKFLILTNINFHDKNNHHVVQARADNPDPLSPLLPYPHIASVCMFGLVVPYPHIASVCMFGLVVLLLLGHMWGSIGEHRL